MKNVDAWRKDLGDYVNQALIVKSRKAKNTFSM